MSKFFKIAIVVLLLFTGCKDDSSVTTKRIAAKQAIAVEISGLAVNQGSVEVNEQPSNDQEKSSAVKPSQNTNKEIEAFRYNQAGIDILKKQNPYFVSHNCCCDSGCCCGEESHKCHCHECE